jgi:TetR/AcrR family transcriptional regulator
MTNGHFLRVGLGIKERKEREKEQRRELIIDSGEKLFLKNGLNGTTMNEIAKACELSKGTLYLYFTSKEQLYLTIILRGMTILLDIMKRYQDAITDPVLRLEKIGEAYFDFYQQYPDHFKLMSNIIEQVGFSKDIIEVGSRLREQEKGVWSLITDIIHDGITRNMFRDDIDPLEVSMSLWGIMTFIINIMDHAKKTPGDIPENFHHPMSKVDFIRSLKINGNRIIFSILKNRPENFNFYDVKEC